MVLMSNELQVLPDGKYLVVGLRSETVDMSRYIAGVIRRRQ